MLFVDPFVKMTIFKGGKRSDRKKSSIIYKTLNPYFNECFTFKNLSDNDMYSGVIYKFKFNFLNILLNIKLKQKMIIVSFNSI